MITGLEASEIGTDGLFLNADSGFDTEEFRCYCSEVDIVEILTKTNEKKLWANTYLMIFYINAGLLWNGPMPGWMLLKQI